MKGLVIWAYSYCRSTLAFYKQLGQAFDVPLKVYVWKSGNALREKTGFSDNEFGNEGVCFIEDNETFAVDALLEHKECNHIFAVYQKSELHRRLIDLAIANNIKFGIASEAPCNMERFPWRIAKHAYMSFVLPYKVRRVVDNADFIINFSGYYEKELRRLGWKSEKLISCGYYPPPIMGSKCVKRNSDNHEHFIILLTGIHQWHRSPMVLLKALNELSKKGISYKCIITQEGPLLGKLKDYAAKNKLDVDFLGFVSLDRLVELYETCSVYVGSGNNEPWGMRLNDALQCGAPLLVNRGMGGAKLVDDYGCGVAFNRGNFKELASILENLITDKRRYAEIADRAFSAATKVSPQNKAYEMAEIISSQYSGWRKD